MQVTTIGPDVNNGVLTSWIPLTTPGPSSLAACSSALYFVPGFVSRLIAFDPYYGAYIDPQVQCLAIEQSSWWNQHSDTSAGTTTDINLGPFACPTGYTTAATSSINAVSTFIGCCPSLYTYQGTLLPAASVGQCQSPLTPGQTFVAQSIASSGFTWYGTTVVLPTPTSGAIVTSLSVTGVQVNGFVVNEQPVSTSATTTQGGATPTTTNSVANTSTPSPSAKQSGLSDGAKIGIGVGVGLAVLGIIGVVATLFFLKRRSRTSAADRGHYSPQMAFAEAPGDEIHPPKGKFMNAKRTQAPHTYAEASDSPKNIHSEPSEMWVAPSQGG